MGTARFPDRKSGKNNLLEFPWPIPSFRQEFIPRFLRGAMMKNEKEALKTVSTQTLDEV
jgi:hypothetical protein